MATWKVLEWADKPDVVRRTLTMVCRCGREAECPAGDTPGGLVIAAIGMRLVFDPPGYEPPANFLPDVIKCRHCLREYDSQEETEHVR